MRKKIKMVRQFYFIISVSLQTPVLRRKGSGYPEFGRKIIKPIQIFFFLEI